MQQKEETVPTENFYIEYEPKETEENITSATLEEFNRKLYFKRLQLTKHENLSVRESSINALAHAKNLNGMNIIFYVFTL